MNNDAEELIRKYDIPVPRYTSYPTALQFEQGFSTACYEDLLEQIDRKESISLYLHVPFCSTLCYYCGCFTKSTQNYELLRTYVDALCKEIRMVSETIGRRQPVNLIHWGGGSPNYLKTEEIKEILDLLRESFIVQDNAEIAMEADPRILDQDKVNAYAAMGINRVSLGVQDFDETVQKAVNRIQPHDSIENCVSWLREAGINKINFDMMYGLPHQDTRIIQDNMDKVAALSPSRLALFGYAHVPWMRPRQKMLEQHPLPNINQRYDLFAAAQEKLYEHGYHAVGIDHFTREDDGLYQALLEQRLHRNFMGYTTDRSKTLLGFGASAISSFSGAYTQNAGDIPGYYKAVNKGELPLLKGYALQDDDLRRRHIIEQLMCYSRAQLQDIRPESLKIYEADGLVRWEGNTLYVTEQGKPFLRVICSAFDAYLQPKETRHARVV